MTQLAQNLRLSLFFTILFSAGVFMGVADQARADDEKDDAQPCTAKKFEFPEVKKACAEGGRKAAKAMMKKLVKKAKDAGQDINCKSCHTDLKKYDLKKNAVEDFKKLL